MEVDSIPQPPPPQSIEQIESADLLVGVLADLKRTDLSAMCDALRTLHKAPRIVVLQNTIPSQQDPAIPAASASSVPPEPSSSVTVVPWSMQNSNAPASPVESFSAAYRSLFTIGEKLEVLGCCLIASQFEDASPEWVRSLAEPMLDESYDLVAPCYTHRKFDGLLNTGIVSPLTRSLYGKRIQNPMGPDLAVSRRLFEEVLGADQAPANGSGIRLLASLAPQACCGADFQVCQAYLGTRAYPPADWTNVSTILAGILGPVFLAMEKNAARWQSTRKSVLVTTSSGVPGALQADAMETGRLVSSFQQGVRDLEEIWRLVLPPASLFELRKLSRLAPEQFCMPDELWVRIVYDFALAHRLRTINRDHLLRSLTPLYLGWVASYAREVENADAAAVAWRLERLSLSYESQKPYLISRWRWPDHFNP